MPTSTIPQRMLFTFRSNGVAAERHLVEATAEHLVGHEALADETEANKRSWFGAADDLPRKLEELGFTALDIEGVISALHTNTIATREVEILPHDFERAGFAQAV